MNRHWDVLPGQEPAFDGPGSRPPDYAGSRGLASTKRHRRGANCISNASHFWFQWAPKRAPLPELVLANSGAAGEWRLGSAGNCHTLSEIFGHPLGANATTMRACER